MLDYNKAFYNLVASLQPLYDAQEATAIAHEVLFHITGQDKLQRLLNKDKYLTTEQQQQCTLMLADLVKGRPLQYVLGHAWFMGHRYKVNESVLIPRPETEELVQWIIDDNKHTDRILSVLDIGTGSGCIPISLKLAMPNITIVACDISKNALLLAEENAEAADVHMQFIQTDFLNKEYWNRLGQYDIIVSNPPYIPENEKEQIHQNVKGFEPANALFVPSNDPLLFYRNIAEFGSVNLKEHGCIYCELHADYALTTKELFEAEGYTNVTVKKDMHGNWRMLKAAK